MVTLVAQQTFENVAFNELSVFFALSTGGGVVTLHFGTATAVDHSISFSGGPFHVEKTWTSPLRASPAPSHR